MVSCCGESYRVADFVLFDAGKAFESSMVIIRSVEFLSTVVLCSVMSVVERLFSKNCLLSNSTVNELCISMSLKKFVKG